MSNDTPEPNATTIDPTDVTNRYRLDRSRTKQEHYNKLRRNNRQGTTDKWEDRSVRTWRDRYAVCDAIASRLELTDFQKTRATRLLRDLPEHHFRGNKTAVVALCVCGHVGALDGRDYYPKRILAEPPCEFGRLADELTSYQSLEACWQRVGDDL